MGNVEGANADDSSRFIGIDGTKGRWVAVALTKDGTFASAILVDKVAEVVSAYRGAVAFGVDVPIGLPVNGRRAVDLKAKMLLGPRRATIFPVPPKDVLSQATYADARKKAVELTGKSISAQSFALRHNILEVQALVASLPRETSDKIHEVHPELCFRALCGRVLMTPKRSWNGANERRAALEQAGIVLPKFLEGVGAVPVDDVLDAAVAAWSAKRIADGAAQSVPLEPEVDANGRQIGIWF